MKNSGAEWRVEEFFEALGALKTALGHGQEEYPSKANQIPLLALALGLWLKSKNNNKTKRKSSPDSSRESTRMIANRAHFASGAHDSVRERRAEVSADTAATGACKASLLLIRI